MSRSKKYSFFVESDMMDQMNDPAFDPNASAQSQDPNFEQQSKTDDDSFEPLIKSAKDIPHSEERANTLKIVAQIKNIEAKTKETLAKAKQLEQPQMDPNSGEMDSAMGGQIDPNTGMPIDPSMMGGQIDPMTGQPMDPNLQQKDDPLRGLGDSTAPQDSSMGMGAVDPMTGMPTGDPNEASKTFTAVGRAYKLKKIYEILDNISRLLHISSDPKLQELYKEVDTAFDLFRLVVNNLKIYKEKVDELIILYYALLKDICIKIEDIYKQRKLECSLTESKLLKKSFNLVNEGIEE